MKTKVPKIRLPSHTYPLYNLHSNLTTPSTMCPRLTRIVILMCLGVKGNLTQCEYECATIECYERFYVIGNDKILGK